jgi:EmrB/QacA subfamily drug resistance transporter
MRELLRDEEHVYQRRWMTLLVLCLSLMVIGLDNTILNVALPTLAKPAHLGGLGASGSELQWIVDSYTLVFAGLLLTAGSLGDRFGRYRGLTIGLVIFGTGSMLSALASSANVLIATRALMGIGGAFIMPATLSILTNVFTEPRERAKAIGIWAGVSAIGIGLGPVAGGTLLTHFWWGSVFLVNVPVVAGAIALGYFLIPESRDPAAPRLDPLGSVLSIAGLGALLWAIIEGPGKGWTSASVLAGFVLGIGLLGAFLLWELRYESPMLDIRVFENPRFSAASGAITVTFLCLFGTIFLLTQYLQAVLGFSTVKAGAVLIPQAMVMMVAAPMSTRWVHRFGNKAVVATGMSIVALSLLSITTLDASSSTLSVIIVTVVLGLGMANIMAPATESIMGSLPKEKAGVGSAVNDTTRQVGGAVGVALLGSILSSRFGAQMDSTLGGSVPAAVIDRARDSIGAALGAVRDVPAARPFAGDIVDAAHHSFITGFHTAAVVAAGILVIAVIGVLRWLPARAAEPGLAHADATDAVPMGIGPVDVTPADVAADFADELEVEVGNA